MARKKTTRTVWRLQIESMPAILNVAVVRVLEEGGAEVCKDPPEVEIEFGRTERDSGVGFQLEMDDGRVV